MIKAKQLKALNFYEDYLIFTSNRQQTISMNFDTIKLGLIIQKQERLAEKGRAAMRATLASSKFEIGNFVENYGKYSSQIGGRLEIPSAMQFYNEAITIAPESDAARKAEKKILNLEY